MISKKSLQLFLHFRNLLHCLEKSILALLLTIMILLAALQIVMRNIWDSGLPWADPSLRTIVLWLAMMGAMAATRDHSHIRIDLLSRFLPPRAKRLNNRITDLFTGLICALLAWHGARFVYFEWQDNMMIFDNIPAWYAEAIIPIGFGIMAIRFLLDALLGEYWQERG
ncbi:MAG: TRAP transporter small permease [Candidatus Polarisedimenticolaceae bacterium]|nr:TRAP transporter small permease [Candidatus Polarisedimenticolaceae bacterium]